VQSQAGAHTVELSARPREAVTFRALSRSCSDCHYSPAAIFLVTPPGTNSGSMEEPAAGPSLPFVPGLSTCRSTVCAQLAVARSTSLAVLLSLSFRRSEARAPGPASRAQHMFRSSAQHFSPRLSGAGSRWRQSSGGSATESLVPAPLPSEQEPSPGSANGEVLPGASPRCRTRSTTLSNSAPSRWEQARFCPQLPCHRLHRLLIQP
jgi:hypothetical protein